MWQDERGNWWTDEDIWWSSKGKICKRESIDVLIDDKVDYFNNFYSDNKTKFILMDRNIALSFEQLAKDSLLKS